MANSNPPSDSFANGGGAPPAADAPSSVLRLPAALPPPPRQQQQGAARSKNDPTCIYAALYRCVQLGLPQQQQGAAAGVQQQRLTNDAKRSMTTNDAKWFSKFEDLLRFKEENGHCLVKGQETVLGRWVSTQRKANKEATLSSDRKDKLSEIGFVWEIRERESKRKQSMAASSDKKCSGCGRADFLKCIPCSFPGCQKKICIKRNPPTSCILEMLEPYGGCFLQCGMTLEGTGCDKRSLYCSDHMISLSGVRDGDQACQRCAEKAGFSDEDTCTYSELNQFGADY